MDKKHLCLKVAADIGLPHDTVEAVMNGVEATILEQLWRGEQVHWGGFLRAWTVLKRPTFPSGLCVHKDSPEKKIRYRSPQCAFGSPIVQRMKKEPFNMENHLRKADPAVVCPTDGQTLEQHLDL